MTIYDLINGSMFTAQKLVCTRNGNAAALLGTQVGDVVNESTRSFISKWFACDRLRRCSVSNKQPADISSPSTAAQRQLRTRVPGFHSSSPLNRINIKPNPRRRVGGKKK